MPLTTATTVAGNNNVNIVFSEPPVPIVSHPAKSVEFSNSGVIQHRPTIARPNIMVGKFVLLRACGDGRRSAPHFAKTAPALNPMSMADMETGEFPQRASQIVAAWAITVPIAMAAIVW